MKCDWKPRGPGDFEINCPRNHGVGFVGRVDHHTKDSFVGFKMLPGFHHTIPDLKMMIYAMELFAIGDEHLQHPKEKKRYTKLLERLRQELDTVEKATAHLPVGDEDSRA